MSAATDPDVIAKYAYPDSFHIGRKWTEKEQRRWIAEVDGKLRLIGPGRIVDRFDDARRAYRCLIAP